MLRSVKAYFKPARHVCQLLQGLTRDPDFKCKAPGPGSARCPARRRFSHCTRDANGSTTVGSKGKLNHSVTVLFQLLLHPLGKPRSSLQGSLLASEERYSGDNLFGFDLFPLCNVWRASLASHVNSKFHLLKYLTGIFFLLPHCSFNITFDILSFTDGNRSRMGGLKIACQGDGRLEIGW